MQDPMMAQIGMGHEHQNGHDKFENNYTDQSGWMDMNGGYTSSQNQSPVYENNGSYGNGLLPFQQHGLPEPSSFPPPRIQQAPAAPYSGQQQLLPLIMPNHAPTWPSMLTHPATSSNPPVAIPPASASLSAKGNLSNLTALHTGPSPRKTLTDTDRRHMCQYHEDNPSVKQTEIGALFGVERSTVSKVLRQREKYLFPEDRNLSPVKRVKGKFPDIERALSNWASNQKKQGKPLTDSAIKEKARFFATTVGNNESNLKTNSSSWLEKFKQKNGISAGRLLTRRASETNISDSGSLNPDSAGPSASQTPNGISPVSPGSLLPSPSPLSASKSDEDLRAEGINGYFGQGNGGYRNSNNQSTTSLNSAFTDTAPSSFSGGPTSPTTPFAFSPDNSGWLPQQSRLPLPGVGFQRPRSQTFPNLNIDPSYISQQNDNLTPKYIPITAPSSALESPIHEMPHPFGINSAISSPPLHHRSSNGSMAPPSASTPISGLQSPPLGSSAPSSPTSDDARRALDTLINFFNHSAPGLADQNEFLTVLNLTKKLQIQAGNPLPGGLHRIAEQDCEIAPKMEQSMSAGC